MSQEQPPLRSRRELRQAREERTEPPQDTERSAPGPVPPASKLPENATPARSREDGTGRIRRVAPGPVDSVRAPSGSERSSQSRARDRAALRTIKELAQKEERLSGGGPPTRRQLRLQQLQAETAPATAANPIVPPARTAAQRIAPQARPGQSVPQARPGQSAPQARPGQSAPQARPGQSAPQARPGQSAPQARQGQSVPPAPAQRADAPGSGAAPASAESKLPDGMTVEQALAARSLIAEQARNQIAKMEHIAADDPEAVDPEILAEQIALAERAAILNKRAQAKQKLAEQASQPAHPKTEPSAVSNLAMVTPLEFEKVPGIDRPVMKKPATSYVPVVTNPGPRLQPAGTKGSRKSGPTRRPAGPASGRAGVLARAEAAAKAAADPAATRAAAVPADSWSAEAGENFVDRPRVAANSAYGLEPLDAVTAGLGRAHRIRLLQLAVLALGIVALIAGITMIISGLAP